MLFCSVGAVAKVNLADDDDDEAKVVTLPRAKKGTKGERERGRHGEGEGPTVCGSWEEKGERERAGSAWRSVAAFLRAAASVCANTLSKRDGFCRRFVR